MPPAGPYGPGQIGPMPSQLQQPPMNMQGPPPGSYIPPNYPPGPPMNQRDSHVGMQGMSNNRPHAAEVEGTNKSKAQLIVGIDFVSCIYYVGLYHD